MFKPQSNGGSVLFQGARTYDGMKEWIIVSANNAGFKPREGGPIKSATPWTPPPSAATANPKDGGALATNIASLTEIVRYNSEELNKLSK